MMSSNFDMDIRVKGKGSIRTLIRLANTRALNEEDQNTQDWVNIKSSYVVSLKILDSKKQLEVNLYT